jgi:MFS family permease
MSWRRGITPLQWRILFAAQLGWMLDAMDVTLYSFALTAVRREFALGVMLFGWLSDRYGRARALRWSILAFSAVTELTAARRSG